MRTCHNCESPVHPAWDYCPRCHADLAEPAAFYRNPDLDPLEIAALPATPAPVIAAEEVDQPEETEAVSEAAVEVVDTPARPRLSPVLHATAWTPDAGDRLRGFVSGAQRFVREDGRLERLREARVPAWSLVLAGAVFLLALAFVAGRSGDAEALASAQQARQDAVAEATRLTGALAVAEATATGLREELDAAQAQLSSLQGDATGSQTALNTLEAEAQALRADLEEAQAGLEARDATIEDQDARIAAMAECLSGMEIAIQFGRQGQWDPAERALQVVAGACADSGADL